MDCVVRAKGLEKRFGDALVVRGIDFEVKQGQCFGFLGPNGAGKTTTLRMLLGMSPVSGGELEVFGEPVQSRGRKLRKRIGVVPQGDTLDPDFSVAETLRSYASFFGLRGPELEERIVSLLEQVELTHKADARPWALSGGMKRRLAFARAMVHDPDLIVLDEPTTGLDPQLRHQFWAQIRELARSGKTLLLTTHYLEEAERLCDELIIMDQGQILDRGSPGALIEKHVEREVFEIREGAERLPEQLPETRCERSGDTIYLYSNQPHALIKQLESIPEMVWLRRPANLEDVFLRLTGRDLKEA